MNPPPGTLAATALSYRPSRGDPIHWISKDLKAFFQGPVRKVSLDAGFTCPNRDGSLGVGGCAYCGPGGSGPDDLVAGEAWSSRLKRLAQRALAGGAKGVLAYFQAYTNTYGRDPAELSTMVEKARRVSGVVGVVVGTRPDCLPPAVLDALQELSGRTTLWVEVGMQTAKDETLLSLNRGHLHAQTVAATEALRRRGIPFVLHLVFGLPGEDEGDAAASVREAVRLGPWGVKLHPLHVVAGAPLEKRWRRGALALLSMEEYIRATVEALEYLPPEITVHRLTGERPPGVLLAPSWCARKSVVLGAILSELARRNSVQGGRRVPPSARGNDPPPGGIFSGK